jgi:general secretion pathway protein J
MGVAVPKRSKAAGFTLMEVMVALFIMALIAMLAAQAFNTASSGAAATREAMDRLAAIDRAMFVIETDLRNAIPKVYRQRLGEVLPALYVAQSDDYWLVVMRGGVDNPLRQRRTEEVRVGYRYLNETIWRDTWHNPLENEEDLAYKQKLLTGVEDILVRVLPDGPGVSIAGGPWFDMWPATGKPPDELPIAIELTLTLEDMGEIKRLFSLLRGAGPPAPQVNPQPNNPQNDNAEVNDDSAN